MRHFPANNNEFKPFSSGDTVSNLTAAEHFYRDVLGCTLGRRSSQWIDFNLFGHQLVCHQVHVF